MYEVKKDALITSSTISFYETRRLRFLISKPPLNGQQTLYYIAVKATVLYTLHDVSNRVAQYSHHKERADNCDFTHGYRLCVLVSGSLITDVFNCRTLIKVSCLHFGQNKGKFSSTVSSRIFNRILFLQTGHNIHLISAIILDFHFYLWGRSQADIMQISIELLTAVWFLG